MDQEIYQHRDYVGSELKRIDKQTDRQRKYDSLVNLLHYHNIQVANFQHERQIHLLVTITFGFIAIGCWAAVLIWLVAVSGEFNGVTWLLIVLASILSILEAAYLKFYFNLENRTQRLYALGTEVYRIIQSMLG